METWFHELEDESKMRVLKSHSPTSRYEADKKREKKGTV